ncbi:response regulator [Candidatus Woesearchaeota archaeon]|nr:response regulator [Candidatus Woesearchaeota archaeon]
MTKIIIIDDNPENRRTLKEGLEHTGRLRRHRSQGRRRSSWRTRASGRKTYARALHRAWRQAGAAE